MHNMHVKLVSFLVSIGDIHCVTSEWVSGRYMVHGKYEAYIGECYQNLTKAIIF